METDNVLSTLLKLKRQNEEITARKAKINDEKSVKKALKINEFNKLLEKYEEVN